MFNDGIHLIIPKINQHGSVVDVTTSSAAGRRPTLVPAFKWLNTWVAPTWVERLKDTKMMDVILHTCCTSTSKGVKQRNGIIFEIQQHEGSHSESVSAVPGCFSCWPKVHQERVRWPFPAWPVTQTPETL